jgi:hypothetical protein
VRSPIDDGTRTQLFPLSSSQRRRSGSPLLVGLPEPAPKRRKAKEPALSADTYVPDPNLGSHLEQAVDDRRNQLLSTHTAKEGAKGPSGASVHTAIESDEGPSAVSVHAAQETVRSSSASEESVQGSSPVNLASSGIYSEKSAKSGQDKWGDLVDEDTSKEDEKGLKEDDGVTTDEDEDENKAWAEAAKARDKRRDSIVDVSSASEPKESVKGPGSASKSEDHLSGSLLSENNAQSSSSESKEVPQALSAEERD